MGWWKEVPFRGDGNSKNIRPRRRFINIRRNRREAIVSMLIVFAIFVIPFGCLFLFGQSPNGNDTTETAGIIIVMVFVLIFMVGIASINKFRRGYDIEVPDELEDQKDKQPEEYKNTID